MGRLPGDAMREADLINRLMLSNPTVRVAVGFLGLLGPWKGSGSVVGKRRGCSDPGGRGGSGREGDR